MWLESQVDKSSCPMGQTSSSREAPGGHTLPLATPGPGDILPVERLTVQGCLTITLQVFTSLRRQQECGLVSTYLKL